MIKRSLVMFQVYLFYGRAGAWAQQRPIIFFWMQVRSKKTIIGR